MIIYFVVTEKNLFYLFTLPIRGPIYFCLNMIYHTNYIFLQFKVNNVFIKTLIIDLLYLTANEKLINQSSTSSTFYKN